jgi:hypothetical protein
MIRFLYLPGHPLPDGKTANIIAFFISESAAADILGEDEVLQKEVA